MRANAHGSYSYSRIANLRVAKCAPTSYIATLTTSGMERMTSKLAAALAVCLLAPQMAWAGDNAALQTAGTSVAIALPLIAGGIALDKGDTHGVGQLALITGLSVGTAYGLKQFVREKRPDGSDYESFPSDTTALAASGSGFLWRRYGWTYGLPAFVASQFVSFSRVESKKHHWYDTLASSAIAAGYSYVIASPYKQRSRWRTGLSAAPDGGYLTLAYEF